MAEPAYAGLDYSTHAVHVAILRGRAIVFKAQFDLGGSVENQVAVIDRLLGRIRQDAGQCTVFLEKPWMAYGKSRGAPKLHVVPARIETVAAFHGLTVEFVPINTWHAAILGDGRIKSAVAKLASVNYVKYLYGVQVGHDQADAICLALYGQSVSRLRAAVR